jgi:hypothetical protein
MILDGTKITCPFLLASFSDSNDSEVAARRSDKQPYTIKFPPLILADGDSVGKVPETTVEIRRFL